MLMELLCYDTAVHNKSYAGPLLFYTKPLKTVWLMNWSNQKNIGGGAKLDS